MNIKYTITRKNVKHLRMTIKNSDSVHVTAPLLYPKEKIRGFIRQKQGRIQKHIETLQAKNSHIHLKTNELLLHGEAYIYLSKKFNEDYTTIDYSSKTIISSLSLHDPSTKENWYRKYAKDYLHRSLEKRSSHHKLKFNKLYIRSQQTKRGTCSSKKNIGLNRRLILVPEFVADYIICHELAHLKEMNHSKKFRDHLDSLYPEKEKAIGRLKQYGSSILQH